MRIDIYLIISSGLLLTVCCGTQHRNPKLTIATSANAQFAVQEVAMTFERKEHVECDIIMGSSGKLTAQIKEGAPFDLFFSADMRYPNELHARGLTLVAPEVYAYGKLVLWSVRPDLSPTLRDIIQPQIKYIAVANPKTAPYGRAALQVLERNGLMDLVSGKLVYGESVAQANQFILSAASDVGFTAKSVILSTHLEGKGKWIEMDPGSYDPIAQGVALLRRDGANEGAAKSFYDFLFSSEGAVILKKYGYRLP